MRTMEEKIENQYVDERLFKVIKDTLNGLNFEFATFVEIPRTKYVEDETYKWLLHDNRGSPFAVLLYSPASSPMIVNRSVKRAEEIVVLLGEEIGAPVLPPVKHGFFEDRSYAVYQSHRTLANAGWVWRAQRIYFAPRILRWLEQIVSTSAKPLPSDQVENKVERPLARLGKDARFSIAIRDAAQKGLRRLVRGKWEPKQGVVHYDLWKGNILLHRTQREEDRPRSSFYVIDWAAADPSSFFFWDLVRLADSFRLPSFWLRRVIHRQCAILDWDVPDAASSLLLAVEKLGHRLECFPEARYVAAAERCSAVLNSAIN